MSQNSIPDGPAPEVRLSRDFLDEYPDFPAHMTPKGKFTYLRTYARYLPGQGRREHFKETVERATRYNMNLELKHRIKNNLPLETEHMLRMEAELGGLYNGVFNLRQGLSSRTMWVGGAENGVADKYPLANFNCSWTLIEDWGDMVELFYLLLVGTGVGFKAIKETADKLPPIRNNFTLENLPYAPLPKAEREEYTTAIQVDDIVTIFVGDSKEGWCDAAKAFFSVLTTNYAERVHHIRINYNSVRPNGEELKTFGGTASGPEPLMEMFEGFENVLKSRIDPYLAPLETVGEKGYVRVRPIHVVDMCNLVGYNVVVGGVRRTSEIAIGEESDWEFIFAKYGMNGLWGEESFAHHEHLRSRMESLGIPVPAFWDSLGEKWYKITDPDTGKVLFHGTQVEQAVRFAYEVLGKIDGRTLDPETATEADYADAYFPFPSNETRSIHHRRMSNNSIGFLRQPPLELLGFIFEVMQKEGEPGFVNLYELAKRRLMAMGTSDPTREQILDLAYSLGVNPCGEINLKSKGVCNLTTVNVKAFVYQVRGIQGYVLNRSALMSAQRRSARAGLRMTLVTLELPNWDKQQKEDRLLGCSVTGWKAAMGLLKFSPEEEKALQEELRQEARSAADSYADELGVNRPLLVTTVKPEGTYSIVMNAETSGLHYAKIRRGIRRIRINKADALAQAVLQHKGWVISPEVGTKGDTDAERMENARTLVIDFPESSDAELTELEVDVHTQFNSYFRFQESYTDHNSSNTIVLDPHEWVVAALIVYSNWDRFTGVSFLAKDGGSYQLAPYEQNPEAHDRLVAEMSDFDVEILRSAETGRDSDLDESDCSSGACPIR